MFKRKNKLIEHFKEERDKLLHRNIDYMLKRDRLKEYIIERIEEYNNTSDRKESITYKQYKKLLEDIYYIIKDE